MKVRRPVDLAFGFSNNNIRVEGRSKSLRVIEAIKRNKIGDGAEKTHFQSGGRRFQGKNITSSPVSRHISRNSKCRAGKHLSINKALVFKRDINKSRRHYSSWKNKSLLIKLARVDFKPGYSVSGKVLRYTIHQDTFSTKNPNFTRMNKKQISVVNLKLKEMLRKGAIKRTQPAQREFLSNLFLLRKITEVNAL